MQLALKGWNETAQDVRDVLLAPNGLIAYDIHLVHHVIFPNTATASPVDVMMMGLSKRQEDVVQEGFLTIATRDFLDSPAIFARASFFMGLNTEGMAYAMLSSTIPYPKPYRVPFAAFVLLAAANVAIQGTTEVYYEEVKVSSREMAYLKRRTEVVRTT